MNRLQKIRLQQIRLSARIANGVGRLRFGRMLVDRLRRHGASRRVVDGVLGYHRPFASMREAEAYIASYANEGHENPRNLLWHLGTSERAFASDYPALFHLLENLAAIHAVFDLGGNAGNVFYRFDRYIDWDGDLRWTICDLPRNLAFAASHAAARDERRLGFTAQPEDLDGHDLLFVSGALHYFEDPVGLVAAARRKPRFILVNRTPLTEREHYAAVQDVGDYMVPCVIHNRQELYRGLCALGYLLRDEWSVPELRLQVAGSATLSVPEYSGFFMELCDPEVVASASRRGPQAAVPASPTNRTAYH